MVSRGHWHDILTYNHSVNFLVVSSLVGWINLQRSFLQLSYHCEPKVHNLLIWGARAGCCDVKCLDIQLQIFDLERIWKQLRTGT